jgi:NADH dehydrogenase/NADH:ubiquinone oxidoreductase subunit G
MGALTLKSFPFELRGWDIEKLESIDPTDGFGSDTRVYISKDQIVQIEPDFNINSSNTWLTDKGRQFFDGIFGIWDSDQKAETLNSNSWLNIIKLITQTNYIFEHCRTCQNNNKFFTIVFENLSIEVLSLLNMMSNSHPFIKLRRAENYKLNNDLESNYQLNITDNKPKLNSSTLCLLISNNPRYEGYYLNLSLRQRYLKGNFKCLILGSLIDLTFPISFLGSNFNTFKTIIEGNHLVCQELKSAKNPIIILNTELFKRNDGKNSIELLKILKYSNILKNSWNGLNLLNPSLTETGIQSLNKFLPLTNKDLLNFSSLYFLNVSTNNISDLKKILNIKLLTQTHSNQLFLDQNSKNNNNLEFYNNINDKIKFKEYVYLPTNMFYENEETFLNTEGFIKRTTKLIFDKKTKNSWQILRRIIKHLNTNVPNLTKKNSIYFNSNRITNFKNYINFHYQATQSITNVNFYLNIKNENFICYSTISNFKKNQNKFQNTKLKYWLDDFFNGGKDEYSHNSMILANCSKILRTKTTNFY